MKHRALFSSKVKMKKKKKTIKVSAAICFLKFGLVNFSVVFVK